MVKKKTEKKIPILRGVLVHSKQCCIKVFCPQCDDFHVHSWTTEKGNPKAVTHRAAHCYDTDGLFSSGYYIGLLPDEQKRIRKEARSTK